VLQGTGHFIAVADFEEYVPETCGGHMPVSLDFQKRVLAPNKRSSFDFVWFLMRLTYAKVTAIYCLQA